LVENRPRQIGEIRDRVQRCDERKLRECGLLNKEGATGRSANPEGAWSGVRTDVAHSDMHELAVDVHVYSTNWQKADDHLIISLHLHGHGVPVPIRLVVGYSGLQWGETLCRVVAEVQGFCNKGTMHPGP
jgi:hypothetical protein